MSNKYYRFRTLEKLLDPKFKELENSTVYFSPPETLNDPQEGYRDIYWEGDSVVWKNLLKNYVSSLESMTIYWNLIGPKEKLDLDEIDVFRTVVDYPTPQYTDVIKAIWQRIFSNPSVELLIEHVSHRNTPIRKMELEAYLSMLHPYALQVIFEEYKSRNLTSLEPNFFVGTDKEFFKNDWFNLFEALNDKESKIDIEVLFQVKKSIYEQFQLYVIASREELRENEEEQYNAIQNRISMIFDFPTAYIKKLEDLAYPKWYTACFMTECENASVWGHYGDNHTGVCLIYESDTDDKLNFELISSYSSQTGYMKKMVAIEMKKINYDDNADRSIDFFKSIGRLPKVKLDKHWYKDEDGRGSPIAAEVGSKEWHDNHWSQFYRDITIKNEDWAYENECRAILTSNIFDYRTVESRCIKYDFKQLKGIIFGVRTPILDKVKIIKTIEMLCTKHEREDFEFYQAHYSSKTNKIIHLKMNALKPKD
ncbi:DUF2971 domain-containing protein [Vibrio parahaemolyticus]|nr:DUF2971 domain-containing protein [Vibrio parahaemolyticus]